MFLGTDHLVTCLLATVTFVIVDAAVLLGQAVQLAEDQVCEGKINIHLKGKTHKSRIKYGYG